MKEGSSSMQGQREREEKEEDEGEGGGVVLQDIIRQNHPLLPSSD